MSLLARLAALERHHQPPGLPFLCWTYTDDQIDAIAREADIELAECRRRLTAIHAASERARVFFRAGSDLWYHGPLYTALTGYLTEDEAGAFSSDDAETICAAVRDAVVLARWREGYPYR